MSRRIIVKSGRGIREEIIEYQSFFFSFSHSVIRDWIPRRRRRTAPPVILPFPFICGLEDAGAAYPRVTPFQYSPVSLSISSSLSRLSAPTHTRFAKFMPRWNRELVFAQRDVNSNSNGRSCRWNGKDIVRLTVGTDWLE